MSLIDTRYKIQDSRFEIQDSRFKTQVSRFKLYESKHTHFGLFGISHPLLSLKFEPILRWPKPLAKDWRRVLKEGCRNIVSTRWLIRRLHYLVLLFTFVLLCSSSDLIAQDEIDPPLIQSGKRHMVVGEFDQAIINFSEHLKVFGFDKEAYYWRAHCLIEKDFIEEAMIDLKIILEKDAKHYKAMDAMGYANNQIGNYLTAIGWFNKALEINNKDAIIFNNRGMSHYYNEKYSTAFWDFNQAILLDSTFAQAYSNRGSARYNNQNIKAASKLDLQKAEKDFTSALKYDERLLSAYRNRGIIRYHMNKYRESFLDFQKAIYLDPTDALIYFHMGNLMFAKEEYFDAVTYYDESLKRNNSLKETFYKRAESHLRLDNYGLARYDYETIIQKDSDQRGKCFYLIAKTYALEEDQKHAYYYLNQARKYGYFKSNDHKNTLFKEVAFGSFWESVEFIKLKEKVKKS